MKKLIVFLLSIFLSPSVYADGTDTLCQKLVNQNLMAGASYVPGIDIKGRSVVPADLGVEHFYLPDIITIPLTLDLAVRLGKLPEGLEIPAQLGNIEVHSDGTVLLNNQDFTKETLSICNGKPIENKKMIEVDGLITSEGTVTKDSTNMHNSLNNDIIFGEGS